MIYYENLKQKVFDNTKDADELIIVSGYIGISPILETEELQYDTKVIFGMYKEDGISEQLHEQIVKLNNTHAKIDIQYSSTPIHSKCYVWRKENKIVEALLGSANFTVPGLNTPRRETLVDITPDSFNELNTYIESILEDSVDCRDIKKEDLIIKSFNASSSSSNKNPKNQIKCIASLVGKGDEVQEKSGLNWGLANAHVSEGDAYIAISAGMIKDYPYLFPPKQMAVYKDNKVGKQNRQNDYIEFIWDDGRTMKGLLEGTQILNGITYPNKICSFPKKSELGIYLRKRLGVAIDHKITKLDLDKYGRTDITISLEGEGVYGMDFSREKVYTTANTSDALAVAEK